MSTKYPSGSHQPVAVVVNDDATQLALLSGLLSSAGLEVRPFESAEVAMTALIRGGPPDIIITDIYMPVIDGWRFVSMLRSAEYAVLNKVPILVVSAIYSGDEVARITAELGANAFLAVPVDGERLIKQVHLLLRGEQHVDVPSVLIVDDDSNLANLLRKSFERHGYNSQIALTGQAAMDAISKREYELAIVDYHLPDMTGDDVLKEVGQRSPRTICIMMTTAPTREMAMAWTKHGAGAYLDKPFEPEYLIKVCDNVRRRNAMLRMQELLEEQTKHLRENEQQYREIFEGTPDGVIVHDANGVILDANEVTARNLEIDRPQLIGRRLAEFVAPANAVAIETNARAALGGAARVFETIYISASGKEIPSELHEHRIRWKGSEAILSVSRDIAERKRSEAVMRELAERLQLSHTSMLGLIEDLKTENENRKRIEAALRESEEKYRLIFSAENDAIVLTDGDSLRYLDVNTAAEKLYGYSRDEFLRMTATDVSAEQDESRATLNAAIRQGGIHIPVRKHRKKNGSVILVEIAAGPFTLNGRLVVCSIIRDITERKAAEEKLLESEKKYRELVENIDEVVYVLDTDGTISFVSSAVTRLAGYEPRELIGQPFNQYICEEDITRVMEEFKAALSGQSRPIEFRIVTRLAEILWVESISRMGGIGTRGGVTGRMTNITARRLVDAQKETLQQADKMISLGMLVSGVAHEINNPNNFVMLNAPILADTWRDASPILEEYYREHGDFVLGGINYSTMRDEVPELVNGITDGANRIKRIVADLKRFARMEPPNISEDVAVNHVVKDVMKLLADTVRKSTHNFRLELQEELPAIKGSFQGIEQVMVNLIQNACHALKDPGKSIVVSTGFIEEADSVFIRVADEGEGISKENLQHITDPFFTTKRESGGTGLGLSVSMGIVKDHGGGMSFSSTLGVGTTVVVVLPVKRLIESKVIAAP